MVVIETVTYWTPMLPPCPGMLMPAGGADIWVAMVVGMALLADMADGMPALYEAVDAVAGADEAGAEPMYPAPF